MAVVNAKLAAALAGKDRLDAFSVEQRSAVRSDIYLLGESLGKLKKSKALPNEEPATKVALFGASQPWYHFITHLFMKETGPSNYHDRASLSFTQHVPFWVKLAVALALGVGTMIGWKRIVVTVGEKTAKDHLTWAPSASAEIIAMPTIAAADVASASRSVPPTFSLLVSPGRWRPTSPGCSWEPSAICFWRGC